MTTLNSRPSSSLAAECFSADWLRQCFKHSHAPEHRTKPDTHIAAAVLVPIVQRPHGLTVLLTKRTAHLRDHAGQVSFPGGRCEISDINTTATALREAHEEVGLEAAQVEVLGSLADYDTGTGFHVTPVVALITPPLNLKLDDFEVADVFEAPLSYLLNPHNHQRHRVEGPDKHREFWAMPWDGYYIWGATAGMLVNLYQTMHHHAAAA